MPSAGLWSSCFQGANLAQTRRPPGCLWYMYVMACVTLFSEQCCLADHAVHKFGEPLEQHPGSLFVPLGRTRSRWTPGMAIGLCAPLPVSRSTYIYIYICSFCFVILAPCSGSLPWNLLTVAISACLWRKLLRQHNLEQLDRPQLRPPLCRQMWHIYIYIYIHTIIYIYIYSPFSLE